MISLPLPRGPGDLAAVGRVKAQVEGAKQTMVR